MKSFGQKAWVLPQPVLIIGTYNSDGTPCVENMQFITYNPVHHGYISLGERVGRAFADGKVLK